MLDNKYEELKNEVLDRIRKNEYCLVNEDEYSTVIRIFGKDTKYDINFWMANKAPCLRTNDKTDIAIRFTEAEANEFYPLLKKQAGSYFVVRQDCFRNDLAFSVHGGTIFTGYNDSNWWNEVFPELAKKHNLETIDGILYQKEGSNEENNRKIENVEG